MIILLRSMTGFGRNETVVDGRHIIAELRSVNHKYFEFSLRISRGFGFLEDKVKSYVQSRISRGKVEMYLHIENLEEGNVQVTVNHSLAAGYVTALRELKNHHGLVGEPTLELLVKNSDIFSTHKTPEDEEAVFAAVKKVLVPAIDAFVAMREAEGKQLYDDIMARASHIITLVEKIETRSPETVSEHRKKLQAKLFELLADRQIDEQRIITEAAIFADKIAVDEETVRLRSHFRQMESFAKAEGAVGRKMDFLVQEMNREGNTIGSKCNDAEIAYMVVEMKAEIEKIREQIQNIE